MKVLLHTCCAPCATYPLQSLQAQGREVTALWYNPNIHPWLEHERRRNCLAEYAGAVKVPVIWWPQYEVALFLRAVSGHEGDRCRVCYEMRLEVTAGVAWDLGFDAISTTLLISPFQKHDLIAEVGREAAERHRVGFLHEDFRRGWSERGRMVREMGLYRQQYCGCLYSEYERYAGKPPVLEPLPAERKAEIDRA